MRYCSTRRTILRHKFLDILMDGISEDGGLYVPHEWPRFKEKDFKKLQGASYAQVAFEVIKRFTGSEIPEEDLKFIIQKSYQIRADGFSHKAIAPLVQLDSNQWIMELFHGPTLAFKDVALQLLGNLFDYALQKNNKQITIIGATSGDTGSAAIEGCKNCENARIFILHPHERTSEIQRRQMTTVQADNVFNIAIDGSFDDCQTIVKQLFADQDARKKHNFTAINSINWARIMAQIVYYVSASLALGAPQRGIQFCVPTGNFGNIFAAYCAMKMGVPIKRLIMATNKNDILTRFVHSGRLVMGQVHETLSPSMDIQVSSNFERYLFDLVGHDEVALKDLMAQFHETGLSSIDDPVALQKTNMIFGAHAVSDKETVQEIAQVYAKTGYVLDPHSAVAWCAGRKALEKNDAYHEIPLVSLGCAHPAKFPDAVKSAIKVKPLMPAKLKGIAKKEEQFSVLPNGLEDVKAFIDNA